MSAQPTNPTPKKETRPALLPVEKSKPKTLMSQYNWLLYGPPKVGKTSFANQFDTPLILTFGSGEEPKHLECYYLEISNYDTAIEVLKSLKEGEHPYKTIVIDTVDGLVSMIQDRICQEESPDPTKILKLNMVGGGYGVGYTLANNRLIGILEGIKRLGLGIVLISHAEDKEIKKDAISFTKTSASLSDSTRKMLTKWVDAIGYCAYHPEDSNKRIITMKGNNFLEAGIRTVPGVTMPDYLPLDYQLVKNHFEKGN